MFESEPLFNSDKLIYSDWLEEQGKQEEALEVRGRANALLDRGEQGLLRLNKQRYDQAPVACVASPDGQQLLTVVTRPASGFETRLWSLRTGELINPHRVHRFDSSDIESIRQYGRYLLVQSADAKVLVFDSQSQFADEYDKIYIPSKFPDRRWNEGYVQPYAYDPRTRSFVSEQYQVSESKNTLTVCYPRPNGTMQPEKWFYLLGAMDVLGYEHLTLSPNGRWLATVYQWLPERGRPGISELRILDLETNRYGVDAMERRGASFDQVKFNGDGRALFVVQNNSLKFITLTETPMGGRFHSGVITNDVENRMIAVHNRMIAAHGDYVAVRATRTIKSDNLRPRERLLRIFIYVYELDMDYEKKATLVARFISPDESCIVASRHMDAMCFTPDGRYLCACDSRGIVMYDLNLASRAFEKQKEIL